MRRIAHFCPAGVVIALLPVASCDCGEVAEPAPVLRPTSPSDELEPPDDARARAMRYLATTQDEIGLDVAVLMRMVAQVSDDPRAMHVVSSLSQRVDAAERARHAVLFEEALPPFAPAVLQRSNTGPSPDPADALEDDRVQRCPVEVLRCEVDDGCREFAELPDRGGTVLTHQALWLLFATWSDCDTGVDLDAARSRVAARMYREAQADPVPADLFFERLAILSHLGYAAELDASWIRILRESQRPEGCFPASESVPCHPHPTALALLTLAHADVTSSPR